MADPGQNGQNPRKFGKDCLLISMLIDTIKPDALLKDRIFLYADFI
jgi:hypothetical protein